MTPSSSPDPNSLAESIAQLTHGWQPAKGIHPEELSLARQALAASLLAGKTPDQLHVTRLPLRQPEAGDSALRASFVAAVNNAISAGPSSTIAAIRSAAASDVQNPSGSPLWTRGAKLLRSLGPFQDSSGLLNWVDLFLFTVSTPFAFTNASNTFGVFPISRFLIPPSAPSELTLGSGSIWFLANLLSSAFPAGDFTGFSIAGGTLAASSPLSYQNGVYVLPSGASITVTVTLAPVASPVNTGVPGADAASAAFTPPSSVTLVFQQSSASFQAVANSAVSAYGSEITLHWTGQAPAATPIIPTVLIPCSPSPATFSFSSVTSELFTPTGSAPIASAAWSLPLIAATITSLPEAAGPGTCVLELGAGASVETPVQSSSAPVAAWFLDIGTGGLYELALGKAPSFTTTYQLWPQAPPSKLNSTVDFATDPHFIYAFLSTPVDELLLTRGAAIVHVDRPVTAAGFRIPYKSPATLVLNESKINLTLTLIATQTTLSEKNFSIALENALIGVLAPNAFLLSGTLNGQTLAPCGDALYFDILWLLPTLPDPYAASFDALSIRRGERSTVTGTLAAVTTWTGGNTGPALSFALLPPPTSAATAATSILPIPANKPVQSEDVAPPTTPAYTFALLDLSTRVDLFGVAISPELARIAGEGDDTATNAPATTAAPAIGFEGMSLALNGALVATFALPQMSWEPMESVAVDQEGPILCDPASDGSPLLLTAPNTQQLVPFIPSAVLANNIDNVMQGVPFAAIFSLPFGLNALIREPNRPKQGVLHSAFLSAGGEFRLNRPQFPFSIPQSPPSPTPSPSPVATELLDGAVQLTVVPPNPQNNNASFRGYTSLDTAHGPAPGYGYIVVGNSSGVGTIFQNDFGPSGIQPSVPVRRIDFSGYGASIFSDWTQDGAVPPDIIKVQFETTIGRTAYEVIKAASVIYPYCIRVVRTVTIQRQNAGWINRTDTGWVAASQGLFQFPPDTEPAWSTRIHQGALAGVFNVRNIRDQAQTIFVPNPSKPGASFEFKQVVFDADLGVNPSLNVTTGGFTTTIAGISNPPTVVASTNMIGYVQIAPDGQSPDPTVMNELFAKTGPFTPAISCTVEAGRFGGQSGTTLRCSAFEVNMITEATSNPNVPALGAALRGAPQIPRGGGWSMGQRAYTQSAPAALPNTFPVPLVQPAGSTDFWYIADVTDVLQLTQPNNFYSLLHSTGTQKILFESPQIPTSAAVTPPPNGTGLQFPKPNPPGPPKPGSAPPNPGSPNLGDLASILNSTGLFPDIANAISLLQGAIEQIKSIPQGFQYSKTIDFDATQQATILDLDVFSLVLQYGDTTKSPVTPAQLAYSVDSSASPSWKLSLGTFSLLATVPLFGSDPLLTLTGGFYGDEHTRPAVSNLNVQFGGALSIVKNVFSALQALAQFLPGGATADLDVALSDGQLTVSDTFTINDIPLGLGSLTDVSLDLGLTVTIQPLSVNFSVGIGAPDNPFNWIVSPLAGNGLMDLGVDTNGPDLTIQAGIGLGLSIDLGIASGSASITIAFQLTISTSSITLMAILTGQASVDVLDGLASASITLSAALGFSLSPPLPPVHLLPPPATLGPETITLLASCSVGIHITICWVISINFDGSWQFSQSITMPQITI